MLFPANKQKSTFEREMNAVLAPLSTSEKNQNQRGARIFHTQNSTLPMDAFITEQSLKNLIIPYTRSSSSSSSELRGYACLHNDLNYNVLIMGETREKLRRNFVVYCCTFLIQQRSTRSVCDSIRSRHARL